MKENRDVVKLNHYNFIIYYVNLDSYMPCAFNVKRFYLRPFHSRGCLPCSDPDPHKRHILVYLRPVSQLVYLEIRMEIKYAAEYSCILHHYVYFILVLQN